MRTIDVAFADRGMANWNSHDLEDILTVVDGRRGLTSEIAGEEPSLRDYICGQVQTMLQTQAFLDALPGHLPGDPASQQRLPILKARLQSIADLAGKTP